MAVLSEDGGRTWDLDNQVRLWDAAGWTHIGFSRHDTFPRSREIINDTVANAPIAATW